MIQLLDCTLRDGGYLNDWNFGYTNILNIFERLTDAHIDIVEIGFLDERRPYDIDKSIFPDTASVAKTFKNIKKRPRIVVGMIDYGTCDIKNIQKQSKQFLDGIRVIFKKAKAKEALEYCAKLKKLGYKVFAQLVSITSYNDQELINVIKIANKVNPYALSIVDTYGLLDGEKTKHYFSIIDKYLAKEINIGFHGHNNFQLAFANSCELINAKKTHNLVVDGTLFGMGKSAGNAPIELLGKYLNEHNKSKYDISVLMETINESVLEFKEKFNWGYQPFFFMCAKNGVHPSYLTYFKSKSKLSATKLNQLLKRLKGDKKLLYDEKYAEKIYQDYIRENTHRNVIDEFKKHLLKSNVLLLGPGKNINLQHHKVDEYVKHKKPLIISINYIPKNYKINYLFISNSPRYKEMINDLNTKSNFKVIGMSNVEARNSDFYLTLDYDKFADHGARIEDNSFLMFLKFLDSIGIKTISCAGFDGYSRNRQNYISRLKSYDFTDEEIKDLNRHVKYRLDNDFKIKINFVTFSEYTVSDLNNTEI